MSDIPCKDCIIFPLCNAQISNDFPYADVVDKLIPKCSLIKDYTKYYEDYFPISKLIMKVAKFFRPNGEYP